MAESISGNNGITYLRSIVRGMEEINYNDLDLILDSSGKVKSGHAMFKDISKMDFIISKTEIDKTLTEKLLGHQDPKDYRQFFVGIFKEIFHHAETVVPNESIIQKLITHCNQAGYLGLPYNEPVSKELVKKNIAMICTEKVINIDCIDSNNIELNINMKFSVCSNYDPETEIATLSTLLKLRLQARGKKIKEEEVKYTDSKLCIILPEELKQDENLFTKIEDFLNEMIYEIKAFFGIKELKVIKSYKPKIDKPQTKMEEGTAESSQGPQTKMEEETVKSVQGVCRARGG